MEFDPAVKVNSAARGAPGGTDADEGAAMTAAEGTVSVRHDIVDLARQMPAGRAAFAGLDRRLRDLLKAYRGLPTEGLGEVDRETLDELIDALDNAVRNLGDVSTEFEGAEVCAAYLVADPAVRPANRWEGYESEEGF